MSFYMTEVWRVNSFPLFSSHWGACFGSTEEILLRPEGIAEFDHVIDDIFHLTFIPLS